MAAVGGRRIFIEGVAPRSLPTAPTFRDIGCVRCVKRLEKDLSHKCIKRTGMKKCNYCQGQKSSCVPVGTSNHVAVIVVKTDAVQVPRFFWSTAHALVTDAAAIAATRKPQANGLRALNSRVRGFRKRIERHGRVSASKPTPTDIPSLLAGLLIQTTRLADFVARLVRVAFQNTSHCLLMMKADVPPEAEEEDGDYPDSDNDDDAAAGEDEDELY